MAAGKRFRIMVTGTVGAALLVLLAGVFLFSEPRQTVHWSAVRAVVLESDDWGLPGFVPSREAITGLDLTRLETGSFPPVYFGSTLEDSADVGRLSRILGRHLGRDGLPAVFQPNYVVGSWEWVPGAGDGTWRQHAFPEVPPQYTRPGLWPAVRRAVAAGVWYPELHARWHYDPEMRKQQALATPLARTLTERGVMLFPGSEKARELGPWRSAADLDRELGEARALFQRAFGRLPGSIIAPDYTWNPAMEGIWQDHGLTVIQAKREQRNPELGRGLVGRLRKFLLRKLDQYRHPERIYLERNCRLEPVQAADSEAVVARCVADTRAAWRRGEPAIVETHRINFAHLDPAVEETGRRALDRYLTGVTADPDGLPVFLTDTEIAGLRTRGTSWVRRGDRLILRNATRTRRVVAVPREALPFATENGGSPEEEMVILVPARAILSVGPDGQARLLGHFPL